jgi:hypothetical protein
VKEILELLPALGGHRCHLTVRWSCQRSRFHGVRAAAIVSTDAALRSYIGR